MDIMAYSSGMAVYTHGQPGLDIQPRICMTSTHRYMRQPSVSVRMVGEPGAAAQEPNYIDFKHKMR